LIGSGGHCPGADEGDPRPIVKVLIRNPGASEDVYNWSSSLHFGNVLAFSQSPS